jgi:hypothetical protein
MTAVDREEKPKDDKVEDSGDEERHEERLPVERLACDIRERRQRHTLRREISPAMAAVPGQGETAKRSFLLALALLHSTVAVPQAASV